MLHLDIGMREHSVTLKEKECISLAYAIESPKCNLQKAC